MNQRSPLPQASVVRWAVALVGLALVVFSFVRLVEVENRAALASPFWYLGIMGTALLLVGLGSPRAGRGEPDEPAQPGPRTPDPPPPAPA